MTQTVFLCQECGASFQKWSGKCESCQQWNTLTEFKDTLNPPGKKSAKKNQPNAISAMAENITFTKLNEVNSQELQDNQTNRLLTKIDEIDRLFGGGIVKGSVNLIGGEPGVGKSTILLELAAKLCLNNQSVFYVSGEESIAQIKLRAERLNFASLPIKIINETNVNKILRNLVNKQNYPQVDLLIIDSIQTMFSEEQDGLQGSISQLKYITNLLVNYAKQQQVAIILVGHITKEGQIAGPKLIEHMVDSVFYFETEQEQGLRILRSYKNRFGSTEEIGLFTMTSKGLIAITPQSYPFISQNKEPRIGSAITLSIEGTRPVLIELQALVAPSSLANPRRNVVGWDSSRLAMIIAVLETHCDIKCSMHDIFLTVTGGFKLKDPGADLAVAAALISCITKRPIDPKRAFVGEIKLTGHIEPSHRNKARLKELKHLGFKKIIMAQIKQPNKQKKENLSNTTYLDHLNQLVELFMAKNESKK